MSDLDKTTNAASQTSHASLIGLTAVCDSAIPKPKIYARCSQREKEQVIAAASKALGDLVTPESIFALCIDVARCETEKERRSAASLPSPPRSVNPDFGETCGRVNTLFSMTTLQRVEKQTNSSETVPQSSSPIPTTEVTTKPTAASSDQTSKRRAIDPHLSNTGISSSSSSHSTTSKFTFDRLPPDVIVSHIFRYFVGRFFVPYSPLLERHSILHFRTDQSFQFGLSLMEIKFDDPQLVHGVKQFDSNLKGPDHDVHYLGPQNSTEYMYGIDTPNVSCLWGYFQRDAFRHPWFLFECLEVNQNLLSLGMKNQRIRSVVMVPPSRSRRSVPPPHHHQYPTIVVLSKKMLFSLRIACPDVKTGRRFRFPFPTNGFPHLEQFVLDDTSRGVATRANFSRWLQSFRQLKRMAVTLPGLPVTHPDVNDSLEELKFTVTVTDAHLQDLTASIRSFSQLKSLSIMFRTGLNSPIRSVPNLGQLLSSMEYLQSLTLINDVQLPENCTISSRLSVLVLDNVYFEKDSTLPNLFADLTGLRNLSLLDLKAPTIALLSFFQKHKDFPELRTLAIADGGQQSTNYEEQDIPQSLHIKCPLLETLTFWLKDSNLNPALVPVRTQIGEQLIKELLNEVERNLPSLKNLCLLFNRLHTPLRGSHSWFLKTVKSLKITSLHTQKNGLGQVLPPPPLMDPVGVWPDPENLEVIGAMCFNPSIRDQCPLIGSYLGSQIGLTNQFPNLTLIYLQDPPICFYDLILPLKVRRITIEYLCVSFANHVHSLITRPWCIFERLTPLLLQTSPTTADSTDLMTPTSKFILCSRIERTLHQNHYGERLSDPPTERFILKWCSEGIIDANMYSVGALVERVKEWNLDKRQRQLWNTRHQRDLVGPLGTVFASSSSIFIRFTKIM